MTTEAEREERIKRFCEKWNKIYAEELQGLHPPGEMKVGR